MPNLTICYDTQKCHTIVINHKQIILSYETFVHTMNVILQFYNFFVVKYHRKFSFCHEVMIFIHFRNQLL